MYILEHLQHGARLAQGLAQLLHTSVTQVVLTQQQLRKKLVLGQHLPEVGTAGSCEATFLNPAGQSARHELDQNSLQHPVFRAHQTQPYGPPAPLHATLHDAVLLCPVICV